MYPIGSYAIPQIKSVNPDMNIGSFTFPANDEESDNVLNSGIYLQFSVMKACKNKEAAYEVLKYLYEDETIQINLDDQGGIACKDGDFAIPETLKDMRPYIENNRMADSQDARMGILQFRKHSRICVLTLKITAWQIIRITIIRVR